MFLNKEKQKCKPQIYKSQLRLHINTLAAGAEMVWLGQCSFLSLRDHSSQSHTGGFSLQWRAAMHYAGNPGAKWIISLDIWKKIWF